MNYLQIADELERNGKTIQTLLDGKHIGAYQWKSDTKRWSLQDIICHLHDEEQLDFRARAKHILFHANEVMPAIDPEGWVKQHKYSKQNYQEKLAAFLSERKSSVEWLRGLDQPNWEASYDHPVFGVVQAKMFLENWLAHDYLHIRQIIKCNYDYLKFTTGGDYRYAGDW